MIAILLQAPEHIGLPWLDEIFQAAMTADVWVAAGEHAASGLRTHRGLREAIGEKCPTATECIDVRRIDACAAFCGTSK